jgi:hypothetical protein
MTRGLPAPSRARVSVDSEGCLLLTCSQHALYNGCRWEHRVNPGEQELATLLLLSAAHIRDRHGVPR